MRFFDYKEKKQHGTFDFPIEFYHVTPNHPRYNMSYHWHTECEIIRILEGEFILFIDKEKIVAKKNDIIFVHSGIFHGGLPKDCIYECIVFDMKLFLKDNNACTKQIYDIVNHNNVITLIENEYQNPLTLDDLSKASGMSPKYFCRFFHEMINKTPIEYLNYYRIEIACEKLLATELSITEIALNCGFNDVSYFIKTFKKHKGVTPKQYLKPLKA